jgi:signal transduction histidine kinase
MQRRETQPPMQRRATLAFRPLDRLHSIKVKLGVVVLGSVAATTFTIIFGWRTGLKSELRILLTAVVFLVVTQVLAHGMTLPLRQMAAAARRMAAGDWDVHVETSAKDEVGELARAFTSMAAQLAEVDRQRRALLADVSHELRTPLAALQARLENLVDGVEEPEPEVLGTMLRATERLGRLVAQILDLSRLEAGTEAVEHQSFDLAELLEGAAEEARLVRSGIRLVVEAEDAGKALGDPERIRQVVANLLENAVRHSPAGGVVRLRAGPAGRPGTVAIEVSDQGPGIPDAESERVFQRFSHGSGGGTGLGLAIARWIVDLHGGTIRALPGDPSGGLVRVELPTP